MFESIINFFKKLSKKDKKESSDTAKERLHLVLMQDRANVSADFLELMKQEIIEVIKKYIDIDEKAIDVKLTNKTNEDGTIGAPALYANIPIVTIKNDARKITIENEVKEKQENNSNVEQKSDEQVKEEPKEQNASVNKQSSTNEQSEDNNQEVVDKPQTNEGESQKQEQEKENNNKEVNDENQETNIKIEQTENEEIDEKEELNS